METKGKILIIDDEENIRRLLEKFLTQKGYTIFTARNGEEGIELCKKEQPKVILLDIRMPGMDGVQTLKLIREIDKEVGVVMVSGVLEEDTAKKCLTIGATDYITKPFSLDYLESVVLLKLFSMNK